MRRWSWCWLLAVTVLVFVVRETAASPAKSFVVGSSGQAFRDSRRPEIPRAALSPSGKWAAFIVVRPNPDRNIYEITINVLKVGVSEQTSVPEVGAKPFDRGGSRFYPIQSLPSPDGKKAALLTIGFVGVDHPRSSYQTLQIEFSRGRGKRHESYTTRRFVWGIGTSRLLSWKRDGDGIYFLIIRPDRSVGMEVSQSGLVREIIDDSALLQVPCMPVGDCQISSSNGTKALVVRSSENKVAELVLLDLKDGKETSLTAPVPMRAEWSPYTTRILNIQDTLGDTWGKLLLPVGCGVSNRCPLVITQYIASPGFPSDIGDEIPIPALVSSGIAVLEFDGEALDVLDETRGTFAAELARVRRPLAGMKWAVRRLARGGLIDSSRVGLTGLSYGAEVANYAYWNWPELRAISVSGGSWSPVMYLYAGPNTDKALLRRGFPDLSFNALREWKRLSPLLNVHPFLPPLLIQSPDREENQTVSLWTQLRNKGAAVEWYEYPGEGHVKVQPANKWWVYSRNLDWFRFWLQGYEDPDTSKHDQYVRWEKLCDQQRAVFPRQKLSCVPSKLQR